MNTNGILSISNIINCTLYLPITILKYLYFKTQAEVNFKHCHIVSQPIIIISYYS